MTKAEMLALADFLAEQNAYHSNSMACHDPIIQAHVQRLSALEKAVRLAAQADAPDGWKLVPIHSAEEKVARIKAIGDEVAAAQADAPGSQPVEIGQIAIVTNDQSTQIFPVTSDSSTSVPQSLSIEETRQRAEDAIRTFCRSLGAAAVQMSHGEERIYYAGISLKALSVAVAMAVSRPDRDSK